MLLLHEQIRERPEASGGRGHRPRTPFVGPAAGGLRSSPHPWVKCVRSAVITAWRIVKAEYADDAFRGEGAFRYGARWHSAGTRIVYTAESASLATLEMLVHLRRKATPPAYCLIPCYFHEALVEELDVRRLPSEWYSALSPPELRAFGDEWARERVSPVLKVPSAITRVEFNYLLDPEHPDFASVDVGDARPFRLDLRLLT